MEGDIFHSSLSYWQFAGAACGRANANCELYFLFCSKLLIPNKIVTAYAGQPRQSSFFKMGSRNC